METKPEINLDEAIPKLIIDHLYDVDTCSPEAINLYVEAWYLERWYPLPVDLRLKTIKKVNQAVINYDAEQIGIQLRLTKNTRAREAARRELDREVMLVPVSEPPAESEVPVAA